MFPPESITTVFPFSFSLPARIAATPTAPAGSTTCFALSKITKIALAISFSLTVTTFSMFFLISSKGIRPGFETAIPSAIVGVIATSVSLPFLIDVT